METNNTRVLEAQSAKKDIEQKLEALNIAIEKYRSTQAVNISLRIVASDFGGGIVTATYSIPV